jgi:hypothetical protein
MQGQVVTGQGAAPVDYDQLILNQALRYTYELAMVYLGAVLLGLLAMVADEFLLGIQPLRMTIPQTGIYVTFVVLFLVFAGGLSGGKRWAFVGALTAASLSALYFGIASLFDLLLLPNSLPHLILSGIFLTLITAVGVRCGQGIGVLSRAAARNAPAFEAIVPTAQVHNPTPHSDRNIAA